MDEDTERTERRKRLDPDVQLFVRDLVLEAMEHSAQQRRLDIAAALELHKAVCPLRDTTAEIRAKVDHLAPGTVLERVKNLEDRESVRQKWTISAALAAFSLVGERIVRHIWP